MSVEILSRIQFALTVSFHYIFPPLSIGLGVIMVMMEGLYLKTKDVRYHNMCRFWTRIFGLIFAVGVASGIVMEFQFGTNWATYSRFVGDVFGSALAAEGLFAFFLESGFLAILLFGWNKVGPKMHFFATLMVALGSHFSAVWIVIANSWMQTPAGYHLEMAGKIVSTGTPLTPENLPQTRAVIDNFWGLIFNPSSMDRLTHVILGAWLAGAFIVISISAYYLLKKRHIGFARRSMKVALVFASITILLQGISGDSTARGVAFHQPLKLASMEGLFESRKDAPLSLMGWVDLKDGKTYSAKVPGLLSFLVYHDTSGVVQGLNAFPKDEWPNVPVVFQLYRVMLVMAGLILVLCALGVLFWWRGWLFDTDRWYVKLYLWVMVFGVLAPQIANQAGWFTAEMGRQPWIVYGILRTSQGLSEAVKSEQVLFSLILFSFVYLLLFVLFIYLMNSKIQHGPNDEETSAALPERWRK